MAFTTKEVEEVEVAPPLPLVEPKPEEKQPESIPSTEPSHEPDLVPA